MMRERTLQNSTGNALRVSHHRSQRHEAPERRSEQMNLFITALIRDRQQIVDDVIQGSTAHPGDSIIEQNTTKLVAQ
jgi:hypothetical protein